jgi:hypothetical protein
MRPPSSTLDTAVGLMVIGGGWVIVAKGFIGMMGDEARMTKQHFYMLRDTQYLKQIRPVIVWFMRWFIQPAGWVMLVVGASTLIAGLIRGADAGVIGVQ